MRNNFCTIPPGETYNVNGWSAVRNKKMGYKLFGVIIAIAGAVIVIHTVPVFVWYIVLAILVMVFAFFMLNS